MKCKMRCRMRCKMRYRMGYRMKVKTVLEMRPQMVSNTAFKLAFKTAFTAATIFRTCRIIINRMEHKLKLKTQTYQHAKLTHKITKFKQNIINLRLRT